LALFYVIKLAVNQLVAGSNPAAGAIFDLVLLKKPNKKPRRQIPQRKRRLGKVSEYDRA